MLQSTALDLYCLRFRMFLRARGHSKQSIRYSVQTKYRQLFVIVSRWSAYAAGRKKDETEIETTLNMRGYSFGVPPRGLTRTGYTEKSTKGFYRTQVCCCLAVSRMIYAPAFTDVSRPATRYRILSRCQCVFLIPECSVLGPTTEHESFFFRPLISRKQRQSTRQNSQVQKWFILVSQRDVNSGGIVSMAYVKFTGMLRVCARG